MNKVYIVVSFSWDEHCNEAVFSSYKKAEDFCNLKYKATNDGYWRKDNGYSIDIEEYDVDDCQL